MISKIKRIFTLSIKNRRDQSRFFLNTIAFILCFFILWPIIGLLGEGYNGIRSGSVDLGVDGLRQIKGTSLLLLFTSITGGVIGTANGWLVANCRFKGRQFLKYAQLIPLATPAYLLSATLIDLGSILGIRIYGIVWAVIIMSLTTYPYIFLLSTESFTKCGQQQLEACRSLGVGPWKSFFRVAFPMAIPSIGAGIALMGMEVINELGAVELLNVPSISAGIVENWISKGNPSGAIALALIALIIVLILLAYEKILRRKSRRWTEGIAGGQSPQFQLYGIRAFTAQSICFLPPFFTLGFPLYWAYINLEQLHKGLDSELLLLTVRSIALGLTASILTVLISLLISIAKRWNREEFMKYISFLSGIGYAIPGAVLALALLSFSGSPWKFSSLLLLTWGYCVRFLAVAKGGLDSAFERMNPNIDEAATSLGSEWRKVLRGIHIPLLKGPLAVGALLVFVDTLKELPLSFVLRPFNFDTLSVRIYQYAGDERMAEAIIPALLVLSVGLVASIALMPTLDYKKNESTTISTN